MGCLTALIIVLALSFAGIIMDVGLTSIYAYFGWEFWPTLTVIGAIIGLIRGCIDGYWRIPSIIVFAFAGYIMATHWMIDGIIYAAIIVVVYSMIVEKFDRD